MAKMYPVQIKGQPHGFILVEAGATSGGGGDLSSLDDVDITGLADGFVLKWDVGTNKWIVAAESGGGGGATDHGALAGLADDDHTQYHNNARGDARYSLLGHTHSYEAAGAVAAHEAAVNPHPTYLTAAEGDAAYAPLAHVGTGGAAHANVVAAGAAGFMTGADKTKLNGIATGATANTGTVTSVAASVPVGISVTGTPITTSGTLAFTWTAGYQGYTTTEASKLAGIATAATANASDASLRDRATHTGTQAASTISDFDAASRAQTEAELVAGSGITITPASSGATRTLTIASTGGAAEVLYNQSTAGQGAGFATDTLLTGSTITVGSRIKTGTRYLVRFDVAKTAAGTAAPVINVRFGTTGTTADTSRVTLTFNAQTAAADDGVFELFLTFRASGGSAQFHAVGSIRHRLSTTGLQNQPGGVARGLSATFDSTVGGSIISISVNGGASAAWTVQNVQAELSNLT